jgi:murein DD-endopeptidase MepM/ murein hydrolase activator NlpD
VKREEVLFLSAIALLASTKEVLASEKSFDYVKLATLQDSSAWLIKKVISLPLPEIQISPEVRPSLPSALPPRRANVAKKRTYTIASGDTLENLAKRFGISVFQLASSNGIENPNKILVGQTLIIPDPTPMTNNSATKESAYTKANQNLKAPTPQKLVRSQEIDVSALVEREKLPIPLPPPTIRRKNFSTVDVPNSTIKHLPQSEKTRSLLPQSVSRRQMPQGRRKDLAFDTQRREAISRRQELVYVAPNSKASQLERRQVTPQLPPLEVPNDYLPLTPSSFTGYIWPTSGTLTSGYGWRWGRMHKGVDIAAPIGTPIWASAAGEVMSAGWNEGGYGNLVKLRHADGSVTLYAHNSRILVYEGQSVRQGEVIAFMGSTGRSTGAHLHFEIHPSGEGAVNPIAYLPK